MSPAIRQGLTMGLGVSAAVLGGAVPASACTAPGGAACGDSSLSVTLAASTLSLSVPASVAINGTFGAAPSFSQQMGQVQVQDNRGSLAGWTLSALTSGNLSTGGASPHTIALGSSNVGGPLTLATGSITAVAPAILVGVASGVGGSLNPTQAVTVATALAGAGAGTYNMTPTLTITPPANSVAGTYTTTLTFTLA
jgi:hypothetical protein